MTTLFVDLAINILLTSLFLWPLWKSNFLSVNLRRVASRTLMCVSVHYHNHIKLINIFASTISASFCTLMISVTNLTVLTIYHGNELAWICIASCTTDVLVNALVLFWLTRSRHDSDEQSTGVTAGAQGRIRSDHAKSAGALNHIHLRPVSGAMTSSCNGKTHKIADGGANKAISVKVDLEGEARGDERSPYGSEAYDDSSQYPSGQHISPILASPSAGEKNTSSATQFIYPPLPSPPLSCHQETQQRHPHQRSQSIGFHHDQMDKKTSGDADRHSFLEGFGGRNISNSNTKPIGILERLGLRSSSAKDDPIRNAGLRSFGGVGAKMKRRSRTDEEDMHVRITVTTHLDNDELGTEIEARTTSGDN
jgi:hypothetical protein